LLGLTQEFPKGILELSALPGLSVSKIKILHEALGISSLAALKAAAEAGKIRGIQGFGAKTEQKILEAISDSRKRAKDNRILLHRALETATRLVDYLKTDNDVLEISFAGSLRRWKETIGTIRLVANTKRPATLVQHFLKYPQIVEVIEQMEEACTVRFVEGARVSLVAARPEEFGLALLTETGSKAHVNKLQQIANGEGPKVNHGKAEKRPKPRKRTARSSELQSEEDIYEQLGMHYIPPELREDEGEIEAALGKKLPDDLVTLADIRGMVHCHTTYSDGKNTVEEMVRAAEAMGMKYITITDHSPTAFYARGVELDRLKRQWAEIDEVQEKVKIKILRGTESDIIADGRLDYPDKILEKFDVIVASIHSRYKMDSAKMTQRIVTAMRNPDFKIWAHALGRKLLTRPPFDCDVESILDVIAESRAAIEVNGDPNRLDMEPRWIREARKRKIKFVISVDAHSTGAFNYLKYGVATARRGWLRKPEVLNTLGVAAFQKAVKPA
jgi:DNA polymerase (family 10)